MKRIIRVLLFIMLSVLMFSCSADTVETANRNTNEKLVTNYDYNESEVEIMQLINDYRLSVGLNKLEIVNHISYKSEEHNLYMITNNVVNHNGFVERSENIVNLLGAKNVGENVGYNYKTSGAVVQAWLESPEHKKNIEGDYSHFGIAVKIHPETGKKYYTNIFVKI